MLWYRLIKSPTWLPRCSTKTLIRMSNMKCFPIGKKSIVPDSNRENVNKNLMIFYFKHILRVLWTIFDRMARCNYPAPNNSCGYIHLHVYSTLIWFIYGSDSYHSNCHYNYRYGRRYGHLGYWIKCHISCQFSYRMF